MSKCKGLNCKAVDGVGHSIECMMDHNSTLHPNAGNNNPEYRYKGYKNESLGKATNEQQAAWWEGRKASLYPPDNSRSAKIKEDFARKDAEIAELKHKLSCALHTLRSMTMKMSDKLITHPGEVLAYTLLNDDTTPTELSEKIGISREYLISILEGFDSISGHIAGEIGKVYGSKRIWLDMQRKWDERKS